MPANPSLELAFRDFLAVACHDPKATLALLYDLGEGLKGQEAGAYAPAARRLGTAIQGAMHRYLDAAETIAERLAEEGEVAVGPAGETPHDPIGEAA